MAVADSLSAHIGALNPSLRGTLNGEVRITAGNIVVNPTGALTFNASGSPIALFNLGMINVGNTTLRADFAATATHQASTAGSPHLVNRAATMLTPATPLASDGGLPRQFAPVRFAISIDAVAPGAGTPTGSITVTGTPGVEDCVITLPAPSCDLVVQTFGDRSFDLSYSGDNRYLPSNTQVVAIVRSDALHRSGFEGGP